MKKIELEEFIEKWAIPQTWVANSVGISKQVFNNKLRKTDKYWYFKEAEKDRIKAYFQKFADDLKNIK